jgi:Fic family protein
MPGLTGRYVESTTAGETVRAFVPEPLPPRPEVHLTLEDTDLLERANRAVGRLDGLTALIPDTSLFIYFYLRKEAVLSSQIEGTQSSLSDLLIYESDEIPGVPLDEVQEVSNYVAAMNHGLDRLRKEQFPLSLRLIKEIHGILLRSGRGSDKTPGEFRRSQNWIGGSRPGDAYYVPPPPHEVVRCMGDLENFIQDRPARTPTLLKAALAHAQFETIHPFLDGNGRVGRLLITFLLCAEEVMGEPILYLSLYFKRHRQEYYDRLQHTRTEGAWDAWLRFFLRGVTETAGQAVSAARNILDLFAADRARLQELGQKANSALRLHEVMQRHPIFSISQAAERAGLSQPTVTARLEAMMEMGMVRELTGRTSWRLYAYSPFVALLNEGTELTP